MPLIIADRVKETTTTTGTGTITLAGAASGFQSFAAIGNGNTTYYTIAGGTQWEVGIGTYTAAGTTLARTTVLASSNSGSLVNFSAGTKDVFVTYPAAGPKYELISTTVASGASTIDFTNLSNTYAEYVIVSRNFTASANALLQMRTSTNNGTSYDNAANTYGWSFLQVNTGAGVSGWTGQGTEMPIGYTASGSEVNFFRAAVSNAGVATKAMVDAVIGLQQAAYGQTARTVAWRNSSTAVNAVRILISSGTLSGTFYLYGVRA